MLPDHKHSDNWPLEATLYSSVSMLWRWSETATDDRFETRWMDERPMNLCHCKRPDRFFKKRKSRTCDGQCVRSANQRENQSLRPIPAVKHSTLL